MSTSVIELPRVTGTCPGPLTAAIRRAVRSGGSWQHTADRVVAALRGRLPSPGPHSPGLLSAGQLAGDPSGYQTHLVHAEPDGSFSVVVMVWRATRDSIVPCSVRRPGSGVQVDSSMAKCPGPSLTRR